MQAYPGRRTAWRPVLALSLLAAGTVVPLVDAELNGRLVGSPLDTLAVAVAGFLVGAWLAPALAGPVCLLGAVALTVANQRAEPDRYSFLDDLFFFGLVVGATALAGALIAARRHQVRDVRRLTRLRDRQQLEELETARLNERNRLETEVTQAVMQRMSALVVQAAGARRLETGEPVRTAAAGMEQAARGIAEELRSAVGSLRAPVPEPDLSGDLPNTGTEPPTAGGRLGWVDVLAAGSGVPVAIEVASGTMPIPMATGVLLAGAVGVPLLLRRYRPVPVTAAVMGLSVITSLLVTPLAEQASVLLPVSLTAYAVGAHARGRHRVAGIASLLVGTAAVESIGRTSPPPLSDLVPSIVWLGLAVVSGVVAARQDARAAALRQLLMLTEAGADSRLHLAVAEQRQVVARDLHDGLALAVTVVTLQAQAVQRSDDPAVVEKGLAAIESAARDAMGQLRSGLAALESPEQSGGLSQEISTFASWLGLRLQLRVDGEVPSSELPLARRVMRECLINIARYAPGAAVTAAVAYGRGRTTIEVSDSGASRAGSKALGTGTGLLGLAEAVSERGGRLDQGPTAAGGFRVTASVPTAVEPRGRPGLARLLLARLSG